MGEGTPDPNSLYRRKGGRGRRNSPELIPSLLPSLLPPSLPPAVPLLFTFSVLVVKSSARLTQRLLTLADSPLARRRRPCRGISSPPLIGSPLWGSDGLPGGLLSFSLSFLLASRSPLSGSAALTHSLGKSEAALRDSGGTRSPVLLTKGEVLLLPHLWRGGTTQRANVSLACRHASQRNSLSFFSFSCVFFPQQMASRNNTKHFLKKWGSRVRVAAGTAPAPGTDRNGSKQVHLELSLRTWVWNDKCDKCMKDKSQYTVSTYSTAAFHHFAVVQDIPIFLEDFFILQIQSKRGDEITRVEASMETLLPCNGDHAPGGPNSQQETSRALQFSDKCSPSTDFQPN